MNLQNIADSMFVRCYYLKHIILGEFNIKHSVSMFLFSNELELIEYKKCNIEML